MEIGALVSEGDLGRWGRVVEMRGGRVQLDWLGIVLRDNVVQRWRSRPGPLRSGWVACWKLQPLVRPSIL